MEPQRQTLCRPHPPVTPRGTDLRRSSGKGHACPDSAPECPSRHPRAPSRGSSAPVGAQSGQVTACLMGLAAHCGLLLARQPRTLTRTKMRRLESPTRYFPSETLIMGNWSGQVQ